MPRRYKAKFVAMNCPKCGEEFEKRFYATHLSERRQKNRTAEVSGGTRKRQQLYTSCSKPCSSSINRQFSLGRISLEELKEMGQKQAAEARIFYKSNVEDVAVVGHWFEYTVEERIELLRKIMNTETVENARTIANAIIEMMAEKNMQVDLAECGFRHYKGSKEPKPVYG